MLSSLLITLREGLEAALLVGLLLAMVSRARSAHGARSIWLGVAVAAGVSVVAGAALFAMGASLDGTAEVVYEAATNARGRRRPRLDDHLDEQAGARTQRRRRRAGRGGGRQRHRPLLALVRDRRP